MLTYTINFDFTAATQTQDLAYLQNNNYQLLAYKGASGPRQVTAGIPVWFADSFNNIFGDVAIEYTPKYKAYIFKESAIGQDTIIEMHAISQEVQLGTSLSFDQTGTFHSSTLKAPAGSILLQDNRKAGSQSITIGLAAKIDGKFLPFCAFTSTPQGSVAMTPHETVCLFAADQYLQSGSVTAAAASAGVRFPLNASSPNYKLAISEDNTYAIVSAGGSEVDSVSSGADLVELLAS